MAGNQNLNRPVWARSGCTALVAVLLRLSVVSAQGGAPIQYRIMEEEPGGTRVGDVAADAGIQHIDPQMTFAISNPGGSIPNLEYLTLDTSSGRPLLLTTDSINREKICAQLLRCDIQFNIIVQPIQFFQIIKVQVMILDRNDNQPTFPQQSISTTISESAMPGTTFAVPSAEDLDSGVNGIKTYLLRPQEGPFGLEVTTSADGSVDLRLVLRARLDRELQDTYLLTVVAVDGGTPPRSGSMAVQVQVSDANDNSPVFSQDDYEVTIREDVPVGYTIIQFSATDPDVGLSGQVTFRLADSSAAQFGDLFGVDEQSGELFTKRPIRFEEGTSYHLSVIAVDRGPNALPTYVRILITVLDVNNHAPEISVNALTESGSAEVVENADVGLFVAHISVKDADSGINGEINCTLESALFRLEPLFDKEFKVVTTTVFDREQQDEYHINIVCRDKGDPPMTSTLHIPVTVVDDNDHAPEFESPVYTAVVPENNPLGLSIAQLRATDQDVGKNAAVNFRTLYPQDANIIDVNTVSGLVTTNTVFDYETQVYYEIPVLAFDQADDPKTATALVKITVVDSNDEPPKFILDKYVFNVGENQPANTEIGTVSATDSDSEPFNEIQYELSPQSEGHALFSVDPLSGRLSTTRPLDREAQSQYHVVVTTLNPAHPELTSSVNVTVNVDDVNDNSPVIVFPSEKNNTIALSNKLPKGYLIARIQATDPDDGSNSALNYYFSKEEKEPELFTLDSSTGELRVKDELMAVDQSKLRIGVTVLDNGHPPRAANSHLFVTVNGSIPFVVSHPEAGVNPATESDKSGFSSNKWLTVGVIITGFVLIVIVVVLIAACRRKTKKKYTSKNMYNCRLEEALKKQQSEAALSGQARSHYDDPPLTKDPEKMPSDKKLENGDCHRCAGPPATALPAAAAAATAGEKQQMVVDLQMQPGESYTEDTGPDDWPARMDAALIMNPKLQSALLSRNNSTSTRGSVPSDSEFRQAYDQWKHLQIQARGAQLPQGAGGAPAHMRRSPLSPLTDMEKEVQDMMRILVSEKQGDSDSLTDSGKGPSEPGEGDKHADHKRPNSEELPLLNVQAIDRSPTSSFPRDNSAGNYVMLEDPSRSRVGDFSRHGSYEKPRADTGLSVAVRRLSDPIVGQSGPAPQMHMSQLGHVPGYSTKVPANYPSSSNNSTASGYTVESLPVTPYERQPLEHRNVLGPDQPYDHYPLNVRENNPQTKHDNLKVCVYDMHNGSDGAQHEPAQHRSSPPRKPQRNKVTDPKRKKGHGPKPRRTPQFDKYPDIVEVVGEEMYPNYATALDYNREQETQFINSVYDKMYDGSPHHSSLDSTSDSVFSGASSPSPHRLSPHHRQSPHRLSPRLVSPPQVLIPQRLNFEDSACDPNHNSNLSHSSSPVHGQERPMSRLHGEHQTRHSPRQSPAANYEHISLLPAKPVPMPRNVNNNNNNNKNNSKRILYREPEESRDSAISEGDSSHGSGENLQSCVRDVVSQYMPAGKALPRDADSVDGLSMDSTTTSGSYVVDTDEYASHRGGNLRLFGQEYLIV